MLRCLFALLLLAFAASAQEIKAPAGAPTNNPTFTGTASLANLNVSGNLGVGTTSPTFKAHIIGSGRFEGNLSVLTSVQGNGFQIYNAAGTIVASIQGTAANNTGGVFALADTSGATKTFLSGIGDNSYVSGPFRAQMLILGAAPTTTNIPASGWTVVKRTDDASVKICANDAGTVKCVALQ